MSYENILVSREGRVGLITLNRPKALNALCDPLLAELTQALASFEADDGIGCVVLTGSEKAFAAGADISGMVTRSHREVFQQDFCGTDWGAAMRFRKPLIAAVAGYALGGGCELAMMCDFIIAADNAQFGQPEIKLGTLPGAGGSQRLTRAIGKAKAMELCLTGRLMKAEEAERSGLVARIVPLADLLTEAMATAHTIAGYSLPVAMMVKEAVNRAFESGLNEGLLFERRLFHASFALEDRKEGMSAFLEKRAPDFKHR